MRYLLTFFILIAMTHADELDMFDEVDKIDSSKSAFEEEKSFMDTRLKLSYQYNDENADIKALYLNINKDEKKYRADMRIIADEDEISTYVKELYYKGKISENNFFELGRVNVKEGVASGFNPTDYFKGTSSLTLSSDPKEQKDNRLGSLLIQDTMFFDTYTLKAIYSPKVSASHLNKTNYKDRASLSIDYRGFKDVSLSTIAHWNEDNLNMGLNLSYIWGRWIFYSENSWKTDVYQASLGLNYTSESNIITTLEYIYNEEGLNKSEWKNYFDLARRSPQSAQEFGELRAKVAKSQSEMSREKIFLLSRITDIETNLDASAMVWLNPYDKSTFSQVGLEYALKDDLQTNVYLRNYRGDDDSEYGSSNDDYQILIEAEYYF